MPGPRASWRTEKGSIADRSSLPGLAPCLVEENLHFLRWYRELVVVFIGQFVRHLRRCSSKYLAARKGEPRDKSALLRALVRYATLDHRVTTHNAGGFVLTMPQS